jgi:hypothetical protein
MTSVVAIKLQE